MEKRNKIIRNSRSPSLIKMSLFLMIQTSIALSMDQKTFGWWNSMPLGVVTAKHLNQSGMPPLPHLKEKLSWAKLMLLSTKNLPEGFRFRVIQRSSISITVKENRTPKLNPMKVRELLRESKVLQMNFSIRPILSPTSGS
jgi:hypothetical protein